MQGLEEYLIDEYKDRARGYVAVDFKYTHSTRIKLDKASGVSLKIDIVKVAMKFVDRGMNVLYHGSVVFENNAIPKGKEKGFVNISAKELNNKFAFAKGEVVRSIMREYIDKRNELEAKIEELEMYLGHDNDIIKPCMKGQVVKVVDSPRENAIESASKRVRFDM